MSLRTPEKVRKLQEALHAKAKESPDFRFYALYDKVYRADVLEFAYRRCRLKGGAPGVDGERFADIEAYGVERWLGELTEPPGRGCPRPAQAPSVVAGEAQGTGTGVCTLPRQGPVPGPGLDPGPGATPHLSVGDRVSPWTKAGCGKSACPV